MVEVYDEQQARDTAWALQRGSQHALRQRQHELAGWLAATRRRPPHYSARQTRVELARIEAALQHHSRHNQTLDLRLRE